MKTLIAIITLCLVTTLLQGQTCSPQNYSWKANKNRFVIEDVKFTPAVMLFQWKDPGSNVWNSKEVKLTHVSAPHCPNNGANGCTYTVGVVQTTYSGSLFYGVQDGWEVRFARKCSDGSWSNFSSVHTVNF